MTTVWENWRTPSTEGAAIAGIVEFLPTTQRAVDGSALATIPDPIPVVVGEFSQDIPPGEYEVRITLTYATAGGRTQTNTDTGHVYRISVPESGRYQLRLLVEAAGVPEPEPTWFDLAAATFLTQEAAGEHYAPKITGPSTLYASDGSGEQAMVSYSTTAAGSTIAQRTASGSLSVGVPDADDAAVRRDYLGQVVPPALPGGCSDSIGTRRAVQNITCGVSPQAGMFAGASWTMRCATGVPVPTSRYRFRIANRWGAGNGTTAITVTGLWIGVAAVDTTGAPTGDFTATPVSVQGPITMPTDGSDYVTGWTTGGLDPTLLYLLSFGITLPSGAYCQHQTETWFVSGSTHGADRYLTNPTYFGAGALDIRIEYEAVGAYPSGLWLGASISGCYTTEGQKIRQSFPQQYARHRRHLVTHSPVLGGTLADYESTPGSNWRWQRLLAGAPHLDYAVICELGTNSITAGAGFAAMQASFGNIVAYLRGTVGITRIYAMTLTPVGNVSGTLTAATAAGATSISSTVSPGGGYIGGGLFVVEGT